MADWERTVALMKEGKHVALDGELDRWMTQVGPYAADFARHCEKQKIMWRIALVQPRYDWAIEALKQMRAFHLPVDIVQPEALHGANGYVCALHDLVRDMQAMYAPKMLWIVHSDNPDMWAYISTHIEEGTQVIGISPYPAMWGLFDNLREPAKEN